MIIHLVAGIILSLSSTDSTRAVQGVEYRIEGRLDETTSVLHGRAELRYVNRARVPLDTLWFHQHLNAFRPNSAWARREVESGNRRFQDLGPDDHAFERLGRVEIDGVEIVPVYPGAPDSTVVAFPLPRALSTGAVAVVTMDWEARLSTTLRRQGRAGRHYDWAHWYPRVAVFNRDGWHARPLVPQGEFFGEFGSYDVVLEVPVDQVVGATGVPVEGDPGWAARAGPGHRFLENPSPLYESVGWRPLGLLRPDAAGSGRRMRWRAEDVHHFAWSANPEFVYEGGTTERSGSLGEEIAIHVLFLPGAGDWARGVVVERTIAALDWLQELFGPYPWPQLTTVHRLEAGGTEFPMLVMNGSASEGLIVHEAIHQYLHGILANDEVRDGWLDEGFTSYLGDLYFELRGEEDVWGPTMQAVRSWERAGMTQPIATPGPDFDDMSTYSAMTYGKAALVFRMLHWTIGDDAMREVLRTFYDRHALSHVGEMDLRRMVNDVTGHDLGWFFDQWLHTTAQLDYRIDAATTARREDGRWLTLVEVRRTGDAWMPVDLQVAERTIRLTSTDPVQEVEVVTQGQPTEVVLDPRNVLIDLEPVNNRVTPTVY